MRSTSGIFIPIISVPSGRKNRRFGTVEGVMTKENLSQIYQVDFEILTIAGKPLSIYY